MRNQTSPHFRSIVIINSSSQSQLAKHQSTGKISRCFHNFYGKNTDRNSNLIFCPWWYRASISHDMPERIAFGHKQNNNKTAHAHTFHFYRIRNNKTVWTRNITSIILELLVGRSISKKESRTALYSHSSAVIAIATLAPHFFITFPSLPHPPLQGFIFFLLRDAPLAIECDHNQISISSHYTRLFHNNFTTKTRNTQKNHTRLQSYNFCYQIRKLNRRLLSL